MIRLSAVLLSVNLTAVLVGVQGDVRVIRPGGPKSGVPAANFQVVRGEDRLLLGRRGQVRLVCSTERRVELRNATSRTVGQICSRGLSLPSGSYRSVAPRVGRIISTGGMPVIEPSIRMVKPEILLSPGNTALLDKRPSIRWRSVPEAVEYEIFLTGLQQPIRIEASAANCRPDPEAAGARICTTPFPQEHPGLEPDRIYFLGLGSREDLAAPLAMDPWVRLERLTENRVQSVAERLAAFSLLPENSVDRPLLEAGVYSSEGLWADAAEAYRRALSRGGGPAVAVALGDVEMEAGLASSALARYRTASDAPMPEIRAAAAFGLGRASWSLGDFAAARDRFQEAETLYGALGATEERDAAKAWREAAEKQNKP